MGAPTANAAAINAAPHALSRRMSESHTQTELQASRFSDGRDLTERCRWIDGIRTGSEVRVARQDVPMVREVEPFHERLNIHSTCHPKHTAQSRAEGEETAADASIALDERAGDDRSA